MPDWTKSMKHTYEYYIVDPNTWRDKTKLDRVKTCTINRDSDADTLGSATIDVTNALGECYIRAYLVTTQEDITEKFPLGTFLVQTPSSKYDGKIEEISLDAYTPLLELKENPPPIGYSILKNENIMSYAYRLTREQARAPVVQTECDTKLYYDFVADPSDTWLTFIRDLIMNAEYSFDLDEMGRILYAPKQDTASLQPVWTYEDDNCSIIYPDVNIKHDLYDIPNVVEVVYSNGHDSYYAKVINDDSNSPISTVNRGREITHRITDPSISGNPTESYIHEYAERVLRELSSIEYTVTYSHGYCPVRVGDCVRFDCKSLGLSGVKAKVISQSIKCEPGCPVTETAIFTTKLWG